MADEGKEKYTSAELQKWLIEKAEQAKTPDIARKTIVANNQRGRSISMLGKMYFFKYNPVGRYTLPKYDRFPMCIPIERYRDGFLGLNLHYLPAGSRTSLIALLLKKKNATELTPDTVIQVDYSMIKSFNKLNSLAGPCIHRYLFSQIRSRFIEIYPSEYEKAIQLPVEDWVFNS